MPIGKLHVRQRLDQWGHAGPPKSKAGYRTIPLSEFVVNTLLEWKKVCPQMKTGVRIPAGGQVGIQHYVFPNGAGFAENHANLFNRGFGPLQVAAGLCEPMLAKNQKPRLRGKYGMHALRHFFCSWLIERGKPLKEVQTQMGHSSATMTLDRYGHLFPRTDDAAEMVAAEAALLGPVVTGR